MASEGTWIADDLTRPVRSRRRLVWLGVLLVVLVVAAGLFLATTPSPVEPELRDPGAFGQLARVDLLPGYDVDAARRLLGPARGAFTDGRPLFLPARTPFSGARVCPPLGLPETDADDACHLFVWFDEDGRSARWVRFTRPGGPNEVLLDGRLLAASAERLVLDDGTSVLPTSDLRLSECEVDALGELSGARVVVSVDTSSGRARQVTCRAGSRR